jgi:mannitol/fructose-specific phosphotransferase system IIA component (Ntr-type)
LAARDETINNWQTQLKELAKIPTQANKVKIADIERQIDQRTKAIYTQFGITIPEAPGAKSPGGTTRMRFDAQGNQIK